MTISPPATSIDRHGLFRERHEQRLAAARRRDLQNIAAAEIQHVGDAADMRAGRVACRKPDEIGVVEFLFAAASGRAARGT